MLLTVTQITKLNIILNWKSSVMHMLCLYLMIMFDNFRAYSSCICGNLKQDLILPDGKNVNEISI